MYEDKTLVCKECGNEFVFTAGEQEFYAERVLKTSPSAARNAVRRAKMPPKLAESSSIPLALHAVDRQEFLLSPWKAKATIAAIASQNSKQMLNNEI